MAGPTVVGCASWLGLLVMVASTACSTSAVTSHEDPPRRTVLRIGGDPFIVSLVDALSRTAPSVEIETTARPGASDDAIQRNELDLALVPANTAYFTYLEGVQAAVPQETQLRAISALHVTPFILLVRPGSGIRSVADLRGHTIARSVTTRSPSAVPPQPAAGNSPAQAATPDALRVTELVLNAFGVDDVRIVSRMAVEDVITGFKRRTVDAAFGTAYFQNKAFTALANAGARLVPIEGPQIDGLRRRFPFIRPATVAARTYPGQTDPIRTIGVDLLLVCRSGLDADLVYALTRQYFASLPTLLAGTETVSRVELERAAASPIPLHEGAARYYRESELYR